MAEIQELSEVAGPKVTSKKSIYAHIEASLKRAPDERAAIVVHQSTDHLAPLTRDQERGQANGTINGSAGCLVWSYAQLQSASLKLAKALHARGVKTGDTVATLIPNGIEYLLLLWSAAILKYTLASLDAGAVGRTRSVELQSYLRRLKPVVIVISNTEGSKTIDDALGGQAQAPLLKLRLDTQPMQSTSNGWTTLLDFATDRSAETVATEPLLQNARSNNPDYNSLILFTSGTSSGKPKGCPRHVGSTTHFLETQAFARDKAQVGGRYLLQTANFRIIAPSMALAAWKDGAAVVMPGPTFTPDGVLDAVERHHVSSILMIPAQMHALVGHPSFNDRKLDSIKDVMIGADMITKDLCAKCMSSFPLANFRVGHGMTEGGGLFEWPFWEPGYEIEFYDEIAPLGKVTKGARLRVVGEDGKPVRRGESGELHVCANSVIRHYLDNEHADSFYRDEHGQWFKTGDTGMINKDGIVYILGRSKDIIKRAGVSITPAAIEGALQKYTGSQVAVLAVAHVTLGQEPFAIVGSFAGKSVEDLKQRVIDVFNKDFALAGACEIAELGLAEFPLNATGKIQKLELQQALAKYLESKCS